ncbi:hypothetical protein L1987_79860 [Smallanthus sonchifolius]|uniref:Uncharacterized protein n=1 Tax=Smallanthus sonchifolius TaxID=185202 RepID=A0ACB8YLP5_9ASTR|nr:hypothetical protein L1987_79860 [Smallanthus sonchifolius]
MDQELKTFIKLWLIAISSICYCYLIPSRISPGIQRLLSLLPIITAFSLLPLQISTVHLAFPAFFFLVWLANFKLILFAFNRGPLSVTPPFPIPTFISIALLPINPKQYKTKVISDPFPFSLPKPILLTIKAAILTEIVRVYPYKDNLHWTVITILYFAHMYIGFELGFAITAFLVKSFHGFDFEIEPHFNEPYLASSIQDFWGRRWNTMASSILRATAYNPMRGIWTPILGKLWGKLVAIFVTFVVSGIMHELMFFYLTRVRPTWEVSWFFVLQGVGTAVEVAVKEAVNGRFQLHRAVSGPLTLGFLLVTGPLFFVQPTRHGVDEKIINESSILLKYLGEVINGSHVG